MAGRSRRNSNKGMAIAMLGMFVVILLLVLIIGFLLIRRAVSNPLKKAEVYTADYIDETGTITGTRGYIQITKSALTSVNARKFKKFTEDVVLEGDYQLFTIICDDGTGIIYENFDDPDVVAVYGYVNAMGQATETFGCVENTDDGYRYVAYTN